MNKLNYAFFYFNHSSTKNTIISYCNERLLIVMQEITFRWLIKYFISQLNLYSRVTLSNNLSAPLKEPCIDYYLLFSFFHNTLKDQVKKHMSKQFLLVSSD